MNSGARAFRFSDAWDGTVGPEAGEYGRLQAVLVDIAAPGMSRSDVAAVLRQRDPAPLVVLVHAGDGQAIEAFDLAFVDYALEPFDAARVLRAIDRVAALVVAQREERPSRRGLWVPYCGTIMRLPIHEICRLDAERDYVRVSDAERTYLIRATLTNLAEQLAPEGFIRVHRSTILAKAKIEGLRHVGGGSWAAVDDAGRRTVIGRSYLAHVRQMLSLPSAVAPVQPDHPADKRACEAQHAMSSFGRRKRAIDPPKY